MSDSTPTTPATPDTKYAGPAEASYADCSTKKSKMAFLRFMLSTDQAWAEKAIVTIHKFQTASERTCETTTDANGVGFGAFDARSGSYLAKWIMSGKHLNGKFLERAFRIAPKYADQLRRVADKEISVPE